MSGCGFKAKYLPDITVPYVSEIEFLKDTQQAEAGIKKIPFKNNMIQSPFFTYLKIKGIENSGVVTVKFYGWEYLNTANILLQIWNRFQKFSCVFVDFYRSNSPFINSLFSPNTNPYTSVIMVSNLYRQFYRAFFFTAVSRLASPYVLDISHFYSPLYKINKEMNFKFGEDGKYYEHIIFIDKVILIQPGKYRYAIFLNHLLTYEGYINIFPGKDK